MGRPLPESPLKDEVIETGADLPGSPKVEIIGNVL